MITICHRTFVSVAFAEAVAVGRAYSVSKLVEHLLQVLDDCRPSEREEQRPPECISLQQ